MTDHTSLDPVLLSVMANRLDGIVREMTNTLLRTARSAVISSARDFSCCLVTGEDELLAPAEGLPVHIFGCHIQTANMRRYHAGDIRRGDAYLDNDPYGGNTHPADHTFMVPVFYEGEHLSPVWPNATWRISAIPSRPVILCWRAMFTMKVRWYFRACAFSAIFAILKILSACAARAFACRTNGMAIILQGLAQPGLQNGGLRSSAASMACRR